MNILRSDHLHRPRTCFALTPSGGVATVVRPPRPTHPRREYALDGSLPYGGGIVHWVILGWFITIGVAPSLATRITLV